MVDRADISLVPEAGTFSVPHGTIVPSDAYTQAGAALPRESVTDFQKMLRNSLPSQFDVSAVLAGLPFDFSSSLELAPLTNPVPGLTPTPLQPLKDLMGEPLTKVVGGLEAFLNTESPDRVPNQTSNQHPTLAAFVAGLKELPQQVQIMAAKGDVEAAKAKVAKLEAALRQIDQESAGTPGGLAKSLKESGALQAASQWLDACKQQLEALQS